ncbi:MAG: hypothetical protein GY839_11320 [candidate division Zixibacteria bacterium]|nr:hypothetical protein [candidate division Zixibacteria bacterium]
MKVSNQLYKVFLEELQFEMEFREQYADQYPSVPLEHDDPDIKRMIEALALFSARTRQAGENSIKSLHYRMFQSYFPYLISPLPAMGMVKLIPENLVEPLVVEKNTNIIITGQRGESAIFRSLFDMSVLPLKISSIDYSGSFGDSSKIVIQFESPIEVSTRLGVLSLYVNYLNSFPESLVLLEFFKSSLSSAEIIFDGRPKHGCGVSYGKVSECHEDINPVEKERRFFHLPHQSLYLNLQISETPRNWRKFAVVLNLDGKLPRDMRLHKDVFQLFVIPIENLRQEEAEPIVCDGTKTDYPIRPAKLGEGQELHSVVGVFKDDTDKSAALYSDIVSSGQDSFVVKQQLTENNNRQNYVSLNIPAAFDSPVNITVSALWHKPSFGLQNWDKMTVQPYHSNIPGFKWELNDRITRSVDIDYQKNSDEYLRLSALKNKTEMNFDEVLFILDMLTGVWTGEFAIIRDLLVGLSVEKRNIINANLSGSLSYLYLFSVKKHEAHVKPLLMIFAEHLERILSAWVPGSTIKVKMKENTKIITSNRRENTDVS